MMSHQIENINKKINYKKKNQTEILKKQNNKYFLEGFKQI